MNQARVISDSSGGDAQRSRRGVVAATTVAGVSAPSSGGGRPQGYHLCLWPRRAREGLGFRDVPGPFRIWAVSVLCLRVLLPPSEKSNWGCGQSSSQRGGVFDEAEPVVKIRSDIVSPALAAEVGQSYFYGMATNSHPR